MIASKVLAGLLVVMMVGTPLWADPNQKHVEKIKKKVAECVQHPRRVSIETFDDRRLQGSISEADPDSFIITNDGRSATLRYDEVKNITWRSPAASQLTKIAIAVAIVGAIVGLVALAGGFKG